MFFRLCWQVQCVLMYTLTTTRCTLLIQAVDNSALASTSCLRDTLGSTRHESLRPSQIFFWAYTQVWACVQPLVCTQPRKHMHNLQNFKELCLSFTHKPLLNISFPSFSFQIVLLYSIVCSRFYLPPQASMNSNIPVLFDKYPQKKAFFTDLALSQIK